MARKKLPALEQAWQSFCSLDMNDQQDLIDRLNPGQLLKHPWIRCYMDVDEAMLAEEKAKHRKKGKPTVKDVIRRKAATMTDGALVHDQELIEANGGKKMKRDAIKKRKATAGHQKNSRGDIPYCP